MDGRFSKHRRRSLSWNMILVALLAFGITVACLLVLVKSRARHLVLDQANERSLHTTAVPRTGGIAIAAGVAAGLTFAGDNGQALLWIALALAAVSFVDDLFDLPMPLRLGMHVAAAIGAMALVSPDADAFVFLLLVLSIAWLTNLFNFMDGSDGLAGGMAVVGFAAFAIAAQSEGMATLATQCIAIASAALAFLLFNFAPAKVFMGDAGSIPLGFLAGAIGVSGWQAGIWELWFPVLVFSPFVVDATLTLVKRVWRRDRVWQAHRDHYYQRLVRMGWGHRNTALLEYLLMTVCAGLALAARKATPEIQMAAVGFCAAVYLALALWIDARWVRHTEETAA